MAQGPGSCGCLLLEAKQTHSGEKLTYLPIAHNESNAYPVDSATPWMLWLKLTGRFGPWPDLIFRALWLSSNAASRLIPRAGAISSTAAGPRDSSVRDVVMHRPMN